MDVTTSIYKVIIIRNKIHILCEQKILFSIVSLNVNQIERVHDTTTTIDRLRYLIKALLF